MRTPSLRNGSPGAASAGALLSAALALAVLATAGAGAEPPAAGGRPVLDGGSLWRAHFAFRTPQTRTKDGLKPIQHVWGAFDFQARSPEPPDDWRRPEFDDGPWARWFAPAPAGMKPETAWGFWQFGGMTPALAQLSLRGKFTVEDPAAVADLRLALAYRGGVVVYLNGQETGRANLPAGAGEGEPLADEYPPEVFVKPDGKAIRAEYGDPKGFQGSCEKRVRRLELQLPRAALRKGTNVLALEIRRAPYYGQSLTDAGQASQTAWSTCGLVAADLRGSWAGGALTPNLGAPAEFRVWSSDLTALVRPGTYGDPHETPAVGITACRNGAFSGQAVITSETAIRGLKAEVTDLKQKDGGGVLPAASVRLFYPRWRMEGGTRFKGRWFDPLWDSPLPEVPIEGKRAIQPVWVKVAVPADAPAGVYAGTVTVRAEGAKPVAVPVEVRVADWRLPDPKDYVTHMAIHQSPDSVALQYKCKPWSDEHWRRMESSFALLAEVGNKYVWVPLLAHTNFGNEESMVRWVKDPSAGSGYKPEFPLLDRYLDLVAKHLRPDVVHLYAWERYMPRAGYGGGGDGSGPKVTLLDPATGATSIFEAPKFGTAEALKFWEPAAAGVKERLEKRGMGKAAMLGVGAERYPHRDVVEGWRQLLPGVPWIDNSHGGNSNYHGVPIGYQTQVYVAFSSPPGPWDEKRASGWRLTKKVDTFPRSTPERPPLHQSAPYTTHRYYLEMSLLAGNSGLGRIGLDFWPVLGAMSEEEKKARGAFNDKRSSTVTARYVESGWDQLNMDNATEFLTEPGPEGPVRTARFELLREGLQECEARIFIEKALYDPASKAKLGPDMVRKCQELLDERAWLVKSVCQSGGGNSFGYEGSGWPNRLAALYACAADVAAKLGGK